MKVKWFGPLVVSLLLLMLAGSAMAQRSALVFNAPFPFVIHRTTMPAGSYTVTEIRPDLLFIKGASASYILPVITDESPKPEAAADVRFTEVGNTYVLSHISDVDWGWDVSVGNSKAVENGPVKVAVVRAQ